MNSKINSRNFRKRLKVLPTRVGLVCGKISKKALKFNVKCLLDRLRLTSAALAVMASTSPRRDPSPAVFAASARRPAPRWPSRKRSAGTSALTVNSWPRTVHVSLACWERTGRRGSTYLARGAQTKPLRPGTVKFPNHQFKVVSSHFTISTTYH